MTEQTENKDLENLLNQLSSDEARVKIISKLIGKENIPEQYVNDIIERYEKQASEGKLKEEDDSLPNAVNFCILAKKPERAVMLYDKAGRSYSAARMAHNLGMNELAKQLYEKAGKPEEAAQMAEKADQNEIAIKLYEKANKPIEAAHVCMKIGLKEQAIDFFEKAKEFDVAGLVAEESKMPERARQLWLKESEKCEKEGDSAYKDNTWRAAYYAEKAGEKERVLNLYEKAGRFAEALNAAQRFEMKDKTELYKTVIQILPKEDEKDEKNKRKKTRIN